MNRGDVYWVNFDPATGSEIKKVRPAVIVSNNISNQAISRVQVIPLTSNITKVYPCEVIVFVKDTFAKAMADQIATVDKSRLKSLMGVLSEQDLKKINKILKLQLDI